MFDEITAPLFSTQWGERAGWGVLICSSLLLLYTVFDVFSTWHSDYVIAHQKSMSKPVLTTDEVTKLIAQIPSQHIFGGGLDGSVIPITSLQLHLIGVSKTVPEQDSRVIISEAGQPGKVYQIGDILSSGVRVYAIDADGVVLENGGKLEKLPLQRTPLQFEGMPKPLLRDENAQGE